MKRLILLSIVILFAALPAFSQVVDLVKFEYDNAGNRISRRTIYLKIRTIDNPADTTQQEQAKEEELFIDNLGEAVIKIYPNPTKGHLLVEIDNYKENSNDNIQIFNLRGIMVRNIKNVSFNNPIDISDQPFGAYFMIITLSGERTKWKIIKN